MDKFWDMIDPLIIRGIHLNEEWPKNIQMEEAWGRSVASPELFKGTDCGFRARMALLQVRAAGGY